MELLDRYLQAVEFWLPRAQAKDIVAELAGDIRAQMAEKEAEVGHELGEAEVGAILARWGNPLVVAERYLPPRYLIGPALFPLYGLVLRGALLFYLLPWLVVWLAFLIFDPAYHPAGPGLAQLHTLEPLWRGAVYAFGFVTAAFALLERSEAKDRILGNWDPRRLSIPRDPNRISRAASVLELMAGVAFCGWWAGVLRARTSFDLGEAQITLAPAWIIITWAFMLLALAGIAISGANLSRPYWTRLRAGLRLATDCAGALVVSLLFRVRLLAGISAPSLSSARATEIVNAVNDWMAKLFPAAAAACFLVALFSAYRMVRLVRTGPPSPGGPSDVSSARGRASTAP